MKKDDQKDEICSTFIRLLYEVKDRQDVIKVTIFMSDGRVLTGYIGSYLPLLELVNRRHKFVDTIEITSAFKDTDDGFWMADVQDGVSESRYPLIYIFFTALLGFVYGSPLGICE